MPSEPRNRRRVLGGAVRRIRELKGIKQDELATQLGIHFASLSKIENNKRQYVSMDVICGIANALEVDVDDISYMTAIYVIEEPEAGAA